MNFEARISVNRKHFVSAAIIFLLFCASYGSAYGYDQYTTRQLDAFSERIGKTYWANLVDARKLSVLSAPRANAPSFNAPPYEAFEIVELVGQKTGAVFYKIRFESGKEGFISPDSFLEELNLTIVSVDPKADEKRKAAAAAEEEKKRADWIQSQPWPQAVKNAAMKRQVLSGMSTDEVKNVLGSPTRVSKIKGPQNISEEQWFYTNGNVLVFHNGLLSRVEQKQ
jgi:hypothetical protein